MLTNACHTPLLRLPDEERRLSVQRHPHADVKRRNCNAGEWSHKTARSTIASAAPAGSSIRLARFRCRTTTGEIISDRAGRGLPKSNGAMIPATCSHPGTAYSDALAFVHDQACDRS